MAEETKQEISEEQLENLSPEQNQKMEEEAVNITKNIVNSVKVDEEDVVTDYDDFLLLWC